VGRPTYLLTISMKPVIIFDSSNVAIPYVRPRFYGSTASPYRRRAFPVLSGLSRSVARLNGST
jgi:hypothetical protein